MRKSLGACVALSALALAAGARAEAPSAYVDVAYSDGDFESVSSDTFSFGGAVAFAGDGLYSAQAWGAQADARIGRTEVLDEDATTAELGGHLFSRSHSGLLGAYVGYLETESDLGDGDAWTAGVEGLNFYDYTTVYGSVGYAKLNDLDADGWSGALELRYFLQPNFRLDLGGSFLNGEIFDEDGTLWTLGFGAEYQLPNLPVSVFGGFDHAELDNDLLDQSADIVTIGLRWNFDRNLLSRDRAGPALPSAARPLRAFGGF